MTKIAFIGDTHANTGNILHVLHKMADAGIETGFIAGDFGYWPRKEWGKFFLESASKACEELGIWLHWVDGNHEDHSSLPHDRKSMWEHAPYLIWHPRGEVFRLLGKKFLTYGGAQSVDQYYQMMHGGWFAEEYPSLQHFDRAMNAGKVDVLVTHEAPSRLMLRGMPKHLIPSELLRSSENMQESIRVIMDETQPKLVVHGHWHEKLTTDEGGRLIVSLDCDGSTLDRQVTVVDLDDLNDWGAFPASILGRL